MPMTFPTECYQLAADALLETLNDDEYNVLPLMSPKSVGSRVNTHIGPVNIDQEFNVSFTFDPRRERAEQAFSNFFAPGIHAMVRTIENTALARYSGMIDVRGRPHEMGAVLQRYFSNYMGEIKMTLDRETPMFDGDSVRIKGYRYGVVRASIVGDEQRIMLDRPLRCLINVGTPVKKVALAARPTPGMGHIVLAPTTKDSYSHTERGLAMSYREVADLGYGTTVVQIILNGGFIRG